MPPTLPEFGHSVAWVPPLSNRKLKGSALVIRPTRVSNVTVNAIGERKDVEVVIADMYVLDGDNAGHLESDRKFFSSFLRAPLKQVLDGGEGVIVARLNQGYFDYLYGHTCEFWYFQPVNLLTDKELLAQAEDVAKAQGWM